MDTPLFPQRVNINPECVQCSGSERKIKETSLNKYPEFSSLFQYPPLMFMDATPELEKERDLGSKF